jgi:UDP-N-acetylmuramoyl-tripeptide--D-alanyl-D-alanine ligase
MSAATMPNPPATRAAAFVIERAFAERLTGGSWIGGPDAVTVRGAGIDSRTVAPGSLFACLTGASHDGHDFAATAVGDGAALVLTSRALPFSVPVPVLQVSDVAQALGRFAGEFRRRLRTTRWIGITGSNGKTTVKELVSSACAAAGTVHATRGNLNNHLGVPLTVLGTPADADFAVIEMGANHAGEIAALAAIAAPQVGVITSIGPAHLEGFGSLLGVARAKSELFAALPMGAPALLGMHGLEQACAAAGQDPEQLLAEVRARAGGRRLMLIGAPDGELGGRVGAEGIELITPAGSASVRLLGAHNLCNAQLAFHTALAAGVAPESALQGLTHMSAVPGRLHPRRLGAHLVLDDSYNANPASMAAGLELLAGYPGRRLAVLGWMAELGALGDGGHRQVGAAAARLGLSLVAVGERARALYAGFREAGGVDGVHAMSREDALALVRHRLAAGATTVLVKGSRSAGLEWLVDQLGAQSGPSP